MGQKEGIRGHSRNIKSDVIGVWRAGLLGTEFKPVAFKGWTHRSPSDSYKPSISITLSETEHFLKSTNFFPQHIANNKSVRQ